MALEPITRQEQIIAGKDLEPVTRMEMFLKQYGGSGGGAAWDAVILCETVNIEILENLTYASGSYENIYNKLIAKQPVNVAVMIYVSGGTATESHQCAATCIYYLNDGETEGIVLFAQMVSGSVPFSLSPDGTITRADK